MPSRASSLMKTPAEKPSSFSSASLSPRNDAVHEPHLPGALGADPVGEEHDLHGVAPGELADAVHGRAAAGEEPAARLGELEPGGVGAHAEIRVPHHLEAARGADAVDGRDDRLVELELPPLGAQPRRGPPRAPRWRATGAP